LRRSAGSQRLREGRGEPRQRRRRRAPAPVEASQHLGAAGRAAARPRRHQDRRRRPARAVPTVGRLLMTNIPRGWGVPMKRLIAAAFLLTAALPGPALAWWNDDWDHRQQITVNGAQRGVTEKVDRSAVLVRLHGGVIDFANVKDD